MTARNFSGASYPIQMNITILFLKSETLSEKTECPVSGNSPTLSTLNKRRSSAKVVARLAVAPNIVKGVELLSTLSFVATGTVPTNFQNVSSKNRPKKYQILTEPVLRIQL